MLNPLFFFYVIAPFSLLASVHLFNPMERVGGVTLTDADLMTGLLRSNSKLEEEEKPSSSFSNKRMRHNQLIFTMKMKQTP